MKKTLSLVVLVFAAHAHASAPTYRDAQGHYQVSFHSVHDQGTFQMICRIRDRVAKKRIAEFEVFPYLSKKVALRSDPTITGKTSDDFDIENVMFSEDGEMFAVAATDMVKVFESASGKFLFGVTGRPSVLKSGRRVTTENDVDFLCLKGPATICSTVDLSQPRTNHREDNEWTQTLLQNFSAVEGQVLIQFTVNGNPVIALVPVDEPKFAQVR